MGPLKQDYSCVSFISVIFVGRLFCIFCVSKDMRSVSNSQRGGGGSSFKYHVFNV